jgi:exopolyphosphatase / guanosine-5'-triphosphate,3'-diphosphate pyrophosphatase
VSVRLAEATAPESSAAASPSQAPLGRDAAVVDVGSNSVRLVIYRLDGRAVWTVYNEKVLAGLGREVASTGRLAPDGVAQALAAIRRFRAMLDARPVTVFTAATAAVREASDGSAFVNRVEAETGLRIRVLSGPEEARYAALGVLAGAPGAEGVVGDLGGSSLELTRVGLGDRLDARLGEGVTLPLGPFALASGAFDPERVRARIAKRLAGAERLFRAKRFFAVGGAWRNLALLHMRMVAHPLEIVHQYTLSARDALDLARFIARQSKGSLERIEGVSRRRVETLPYAALVLEGVVERLGIERVELSAYGVREGLLLEAMAPDVAAEDPLLAGLTALGARTSLAEGLGPALEAWLAPALVRLSPLFPDGREAVLAAAAARLADAGAQFHPDHRADLVFDQVLRAPVAGWTHPERAFVAVATFARYDGRDAAPEPSVTGRLLDPERVQRARVLGAALRLGADLSGRSPALLARTRLSLTKEAVTLSARPEDAEVLLGDPARKRLQALAALLDREPRLRAE